MERRKSIHHALPYVQREQCFMYIFSVRVLKLHTYGEKIIETYSWNIAVLAKKIEARREEACLPIRTLTNLLLQDREEPSEETLYVCVEMLLRIQMACKAWLRMRTCFPHLSAAANEPGIVAAASRLPDNRASFRDTWAEDEAKYTSSAKADALAKTICKRNLTCSPQTIVRIMMEEWGKTQLDSIGKTGKFLDKARITRESSHTVSSLGWRYCHRSLVARPAFLFLACSTSDTFVKKQNQHEKKMAKIFWKSLFYALFFCNPARTCSNNLLDALSTQ